VERESTSRLKERRMDCVTMLLMERETGLPLDLIILINNFLYEKLTDENFKQAIDLWFENVVECRLRLVTSAFGRPRESPIWKILSVIK
jgi:hypothetical protein